MDKFRKKRIIAAVTDVIIVLMLDMIILFLLNHFIKVKPYYVIPGFFIIHILYFTLSEFSGLKATPGMYFQKLTVSRSNKYNAGFPALLLRSFASFFSCIPAGFGLWYCLKDERGLTIYDYASDTVVELSATENSNADSVYIVGTGKVLKGQKIKVADDGLIIGRNPSICNVILPPNEPCVSRVHCRVVYNRQTGTLLVEDMGSKFGTYISQGIKLDKGQTAAISPGNSFFLGTSNVKFIFYS